MIAARHAYAGRRHDRLIPAATRARRLAVLAVLSITAPSCNRGTTPDAYGNFEAEEVVISAETSGQLRAFALVEGASVDSGALVAMIDTVQLTLERDRLQAERAALLSRQREARRQANALAAQQAVATRSWRRAQRLVDADAGTATQVDQSERDVRAVDAQLVTARGAIERSGNDLASLDARLAQVHDRLARASVRAPVGGTVLATYARVGEVIQPGQPLARVADLRDLTLRAYITGEQLPRVRLGQQMAVRIGTRADAAPVQGVVSWISAKAEFTPTPIQTRDERAELVYAIKLRVPNRDGTLKIGMPADVTLPGATSATR